MWFLRQEWIPFMWKQRAASLYTAEDMQFAIAMRKFLNIPSLIGPFVPDDATWFPLKAYQANLAESRDARAVIQQWYAVDGHYIVERPPLDTLVFAHSAALLDSLATHLLTPCPQGEADGFLCAGALGRTAVLYDSRLGARMRESAETICAITDCSFLVKADTVSSPVTADVHIRGYDLHLGYGLPATPLPAHTEAAEIVQKLVSILQGVRPKRFLHLSDNTPQDAAVQLALELFNNFNNTQ